MFKVTDWKINIITHAYFICGSLYLVKFSNARRGTEGKLHRDHDQDEQKQCRSDRPLARRWPPPLLRYYADTFDPTLAGLVVASFVAKRQMTIVCKWKELTLKPSNIYHLILVGQS